jgi:hypothetical protein
VIAERASNGSKVQKLDSRSKVPRFKVQHFADSSRSTVQSFKGSTAAGARPFQMFQIVPAVPPLLYVQPRSSSFNSSAVQSFNIFEIAAVQWSSSSP